MKFKLVPEPPAELVAAGDPARTAERLTEIRRAVPLVPDGELDCCARLRRREGFETDDVSRTWLTFLRALALVEETDSGFRRLREAPTPAALQARFRERVLGAEAVLAELAAADGPLPAETAFERVRERVPVWEHRRDPAGWEATWADRTRHLLDWLVALGLADRVESGYVRADATAGDGSGAES